MMKYSNRCKPIHALRAKSNAIAISNGLDKITKFFTGETRREVKPFFSPDNMFAGLMSKFLNKKRK